MSIVTFKRGDTTALTKNFTRDEFQCQCKKCEAQMIDTELAEKLQRIRDVLGVPLKITSGYRCIVHNASKAVGGSRTSKHLYGFAADWRTLNRTVSPVALGIIAQAVGFGGIGIYWHPQGGHVPRGHPRRESDLALHVAGRLSLDHIQCLYFAHHPAGQHRGSQPQRHHHAAKAAQNQRGRYFRACNHAGPYACPEAARACCGRHLRPGKLESPLWC